MSILIKASLAVALLCSSCRAEVIRNQQRDYQPQQVPPQSARAWQGATSVSSSPSPKKPSFRPGKNPKAPTGSNEIHTNGSVCGDPSGPCKNPYQFQDNNLSFHLPQQLTWQNNYYSAKFYAVILKSKPAVVDNGPDSGACEQGIVPEAERQRIQAIFPTHKVFTSTFGCYMTDVWYLNTDNAYNFVAVYAGESLVDAKSLLAKVKATGQFPEANIRKTQVVLGYGD